MKKIDLSKDYTGVELLLYLYEQHGEEVFLKELFDFIYSDGEEYLKEKTIQAIQAICDHLSIKSNLAIYNIGEIYELNIGNSSLLNAELRAEFLDILETNSIDFSPEKSRFPITDYLSTSNVNQKPSHTINLDFLIAQNQNLEAQLAELKAQLDSKEAEYSSYVEKINSLESEANLHKQKISNLQIDILKEQAKSHKLADSVADFERKNSMLSEENEKLQERVQRFNLEIAELLNNQQEQRGDFEMIDEVVDKNKDPEMYQLVTRLASLPEDDREEELKQVYAQIDEYKGARVDGSAYEFAKKHWGIWLRLKWAGRKHLRKRGGNKFVNQLQNECEREGVDFDEFAIANTGLTKAVVDSVSKKQKRAVKAMERRNSQ